MIASVPTWGSQTGMVISAVIIVALLVATFFVGGHRR